MAVSLITEPVPEWVDEDPETESSMEMDDEELEFDAFEGNHAEIDTEAEKAGDVRDDVPLWRLIEMSREDRSLRMELADFEDYDDFDSSDYASGMSH